MDDLYGGILPQESLRWNYAIEVHGALRTKRGGRTPKQSDEGRPSPKRDVSIPRAGRVFFVFS